MTDQENGTGISKMRVKLFDKNVMVVQVKKDTIKLHLPSDVSSKDSPIYDLVVSNVGDGVTRVKVGDKVMGHFPPQCAVYDPETCGPAMLVQESMILGVFKEWSRGGSCGTTRSFDEIVCEKDEDQC